MEENRISREQLFIEMAFLISRRATCCRLSVGAVAVQNNRAVHMGYNGTPVGETHCNPIDCDTDKPCTRAIHAEDNLIKSAHNLGIDLKGAKLFVTHQPCYNCSKVIVKAGIDEVYYAEPYRKEEGLINLINNDIKVYQINEQGQYTRRQPMDISKILQTG